MGLPCGSAGKQSDCSAGDLGSIPGLGRSPEKGKGYPLQYSGLENSIWLYSPWGCKESDTTAIFTLGTLIIPRPPTFLPFFCSFLNHSPSDFFLFYLTFFFFLKIYSGEHNHLILLLELLRNVFSNVSLFSFGNLQTDRLCPFITFILMLTLKYHSSFPSFLSFLAHTPACFCSLNLLFGFFFLPLSLLFLFKF